MRSNVVAAAAPSQNRPKQVGMGSTDIAKMRGLFGLPKEEKLIGVYKCSVTREINAQKEDQPNVGELFIFESHIAFDLKMFAFHKQWVIDARDVVKLLKTSSNEDVVQIQCKGSSYEVHFNDNCQEACLVIEACRLGANTAALSNTSADEVTDPAEDLDNFKHMIEPIIMNAEDNHKKHQALDFDLQEEDWKHFMTGAKQLKFRKGQYVLQEGQATAALYQIIQGKLRVELQLKDRAQAVVVGYRTAGEMFGETSLLKSGVATASIAADEDATLICLEGTFLEQLFMHKPELPSRFFCFIAAYQADRLYKLTQTAAQAQGPQVTAVNRLRIPLTDVLSNPAYCGVFRKYLSRELDQNPTKKGADFSPKLAMDAFNFFTACKSFRTLPSLDALCATAKELASTFVHDPASDQYLAFLDEDTRNLLSESIKELSEGKITNTTGRRIFSNAENSVFAFLEKNTFEPFLGSPHYQYILELKVKEGIVPKLQDFQVLRVLGEGGFGQVIEVVKRDCGVHYAMKVMQKEAMKQNLGSSWRKKIALEAYLLAALSHPFMVNLKYAFQNADFLCLVMDLVPSGDLSEFVLTAKRLTPEQTNWAMMEVTEVISYMHSQKILYRDLKPENLLVDDEGHVRLIDMGLAIRWTGDKPRRSSRVGTDCYMAPEVRWARKQNQSYGTSCDWYTVGVLLYEFSNGALPFTKRDTYQPVYREGTWPNADCKDLCEGLLVQDWRKRTGCGSQGVDEIKKHPYFKHVDWEIVTACKIKSPMKGVKGLPKRKKDKEVQAQRTAGYIAESDNKDVVESVAKMDTVEQWDFVATTAITDEYMESMYMAVSSI